MKQTIKWVSMAMFILTWSGLAKAQDFTGLPERATYAGAYFSISFGGDSKTYKRPVRYGFSAGFRQTNATQFGSYYGSQFGQRDVHLNMIESRDLQARIVDLNFSGRGFERLSLSGMAFAKRDEWGQVTYMDGLRQLNADGDEEGGSLRTWLWIGAGVGAVALVASQLIYYRGE